MVKVGGRRKGVGDRGRECEGESEAERRRQKE